MRIFSTKCQGQPRSRKQVFILGLIIALICVQLIAMVYMRASGDTEGMSDIISYIMMTNGVLLVFMASGKNNRACTADKAGTGK